MRTLLMILLAVTLTSSGCGLELLTPASASVAVSRVNEGVRLTNRTDRPVAYAVWNPGWLASFAPCTFTDPRCPRLDPGESVVIPLSEVGGYVPGLREALVRWWHVVPEGAGGYRVEEVHEVTIAL